MMKNSEYIDEVEEIKVKENTCQTSQKQLVFSAATSACFEEKSQKLLDSDSNHFVLGYN